ncbi:MAG: hypothetical protein NZ516_02420 [Raineya sp.]|nr:hypothetical protein [Raineya sp.]
MQTKKFFAVLVLLAIGFTIVSCGNKESDKKTADTTITQKVKDEVIKNVAEAVKQLPPVQELPDLLASAGVDDFYEKLVNPAKNVDKYLTTNDLAAMNFGVYVMDLGYVLNYEKIQLGSEYMNACQKLADKIGVSSAIDQKKIERFGKNLDKKDSLIKIANETVQNIDKYLRANERANVSAIILGAMFVEGLHISTSIITMPSDMDKNTKDLVFSRMVKIIADQEKSLDDAISSLEAVKPTDKAQELLNGLKAIKQVYVEKKYGEKFASYKTGEKIPVSTEDLKPLQEKAQSVRKLIVE